MCSETLRVCIHLECGSFSFPERHDCSEAQYCLLKEMTETFPRFKDKTGEKNKKTKKPCKILFCFQAWYPLKLFSLMELELEKYRFKMVFDSWHCDVDASVIGPASDFWHRCEDTVCKCLLRTSCTQFELCRMSVRIFCIFKSWTSIFSPNFIKLSLPSALDNFFRFLEKTLSKCNPCFF